MPEKSATKIARKFDILILLGCHPAGRFLLVSDTKGNVIVQDLDADWKRRRILYRSTTQQQHPSYTSNYNPHLGLHAIGVAGSGGHGLLVTNHGSWSCPVACVISR